MDDEDPDCGMWDLVRFFWTWVLILGGLALGAAIAVVVLWP